MPSPVALHHLIVAVSDRDAAVAWFVELLELREPWDNGFFRSVQLDDRLVLNFAGAPPDLTPQHYAFLVTEEHFDRIQARFDAEGTHYTADPPGRRPGQVGEANPDGTGRRLYFFGPDRHMLEVITARYIDVPRASGTRGSLPPGW
jgi:catechol 2,3-dioxygenase-like lactoylglutathione lyase family enzyme